MKANSLHLVWRPHYNSKTRETFRGVKSVGRAKEILAKRPIGNMAAAGYVNNDGAFTELVNANGLVIN